MRASSSTARAAAPAATGIAQRLVWIMAVASALIVANLYYLQPVLADVARAMGVGEGQVGIVATLTQLGYALGLLLIVPLGDALNRRKLIVATVLAVAVALGLVAVAPNVVWLATASFLVGALAVGAQIIVPLAASLARPEERGRVVGTVMSGLLIGILLARTVSGFVSAHAGWRTMFWLGVVAMIGLAALLYWSLPEDTPRKGLGYTALLRSLGTLVRTQPVLREACVFGALAFGAFSVFWVALAFFLETPPYHYGSAVAGAFGLVGVVGALAASFVGKLADRIDSRRITGAALAIALVAFGCFWSLGGWLWGLIVGVILLDLGVQAAHIANQTRVYALLPEARSRLNTIYIVSYFLGGALGSTLSTIAWSFAGWTGVCAAGALMLGLALFTYALGTRRRA